MTNLQYRSARNRQLTHPTRLLLCAVLLLAGQAVSGQSSTFAFDGRDYNIRPPKYSMEAIEKHIKVNPLDPEAYCDRGQANLTAGECEDAVLDYSHALKIKPNMARALLGRSQAYEMMGKHEPALADVNAAIVCDDKHTKAAAILQKITINRGLNRSAESIPLYSQLLESKDWGVGAKDRFNLLEDRAAAYLVAGKAELAVKDVLATMDDERGHITKYVTLAAAYQKLKKPDLVLKAYSEGIAKGEFKQARSKIPDRHLINLYQARAKYYQQTGQNALAQADLKRIHSTNFETVYEEAFPSLDRKNVK